MEFVPILDESSHDVQGFAERAWAERNNLLHPTVLLVPVTSDGRIYIQTRPEGKCFAGCRDFFGGHVTFSADKMQWPIDLREAILQAAEREANEELRMYVGPERNAVHIGLESLMQVGDVGEFGVNVDGNRERSTLFIVPTLGCELRPMDDIDGHFVDVQHEIFEWRELLSKFNEYPQNLVTARGATYSQNHDAWQFADGAARIVGDPLRARALKAAIHRGFAKG